MTAPTASRLLLSYLGLVQFLFLLTWAVYAIFLGDLLAKLGLPKAFAPRLLLLDQLLFACADIVLGLYADRAMRLFRGLAPVVLGLNLIACLAFVALPLLRVGDAALFVALAALWVLTSSVLRAPLYALIARRGHAPGRATAVALLGMGLAGALAPYLGTVLKGVDPLLPFALSGVSLALATLGFAAWEARQRPADRVVDSVPRPAFTTVWRWLAAMLLLGAGLQVHIFVNSAPLYKGLADPSLLHWLLPVFWIGFSLAVSAGQPVVERVGARRAFARAALLGTAACTGCLAAPNLPLLIALQVLAGTAWGGALLAGLMGVGGVGRHGREGLFVGTLFASLALGAAARVGLTLAGIPFSAQVTLPLAAALWGAGVLLCLTWLRAPSGASASN
ncbi:MFS transporter [uncultured Thiodictyon sp.]|uniref:MFS transporter n=1 Tax=uncultured Thiodictyon sp. TaxID=1846217 RepID=UPI0025F9BEBC|nr:MFS transporter [uncultured Thiodictyon sp.]